MHVCECARWGRGGGLGGCRPKITKKGGSDTTRPRGNQGKGEEVGTKGAGVGGGGKGGCMPSDACCCILSQILSGGRLVKISWSEGTATKPRPRLTAPCPFLPSPATSSPDCSGSGAWETLAFDAKGFQAAWKGVGVGASEPLLGGSGPLAPVLLSSSNLVETGFCTAPGQALTFVVDHTYIHLHFRTHVTLDLGCVT